MPEPVYSLLARGIGLTRAGVIGRLRRYAALGMLTAGQSLSGFLVSALAAYYFGAGALKDAWDVAYMIPTVLLVVAGFQSFQGIATAIFARLSATADDDPDVVLTTLVVTLGVAALAFSGIAFAARAPLVALVAPGLRPETAAIAVRELGILLAIIPFIGVAIVLGAVQVAYGYAGANETVWIVVRAIVIALLFALPTRLGVTRLSFGFAAGSVAALGVQLYFLRRTPVRLVGRLSFASRHVRDALAQGGLFVILTLATQACVVAARDLCSRGAEGTIAAYGYALSLLGPLYQFVAKPIMLLEGPRIVRNIEEDAESARRLYDRALLIGLAVIVPAALALLLLREPIVRLLFERGRLDAAATARIAEFVGVLAFTAVGDGLLSMSALPAIVQRRSRIVPLVLAGVSFLQLAFMYVSFAWLSFLAVAWGALLASTLKGAFVVWFSRRSIAQRGRHGH